MANSPFDDVKVLFTKQGELSKHPAWFMLNRIISFSGKHFGIATSMNHCIFKLQTKHDELLKLIYNGLIPKQKTPWFNYIKKPKEDSGDYEELFKNLQVYFHWTDKEFKAMKSLLLHLVKNQNHLRKMMRFVGAEKKQYDKLGLQFDMEDTGLGKFMR